jgi:hypothetical protein
MSLAGLVGLAGLAKIHHAQTPDAVEYVKICSLYGAGFHYVPGTDYCQNDVTGDTREQTEGGTWRTITPYEAGKWVTHPEQECESGRLVKVGNFLSTDFTLNVWQKGETQPVTVRVNGNEMITKVIMSGGFYDPRIPNRHGANDTDGLCLRSIDPTLLENIGGNLINLPFGNGNLPIGCIANSRIVNMPAAYSISATSAYPDVDSSFTDGTQTVVAGPYLYGKQLVVTTDLGNNGGAPILTYYNAVTELYVPLAGKLSVSVCIEDGRNFSNFGN